jgi:DNA-binding NarL/FixJ family response regulator
VGEGFTNKQIAERLGVSVRTAESHVEQIRTKLGFRSRTQIARWVARREPGREMAGPAL